MHTSAPISLENVEVFRGDEDGGHVVRGVTLNIAAGERVFLLGPNGAGKTSLLLAMVGAARHAGRVRFGDVELGPKTLDAVRRSVGLVFADPRDQFFLNRVEDEVAFAPRERGLPEASVTERVAQALAAMDLGGYRDRAPDTLSLGEQRRLAIATMLAGRPDVLLLDEPTASLDPRARRRILDVIAGLSATIVVATHDLDAAFDLGGRVVLLDQGRVVADGDARALLVDAPMLEAAGLSLPLAVQGVSGNPKTKAGES
jgi:cobalt/nickel transport system ATP-binding protein